MRSPSTEQQNALLVLGLGLLVSGREVEVQPERFYHRVRKENRWYDLSSSFIVEEGELFGFPLDFNFQDDREFRKKYRMQKVTFLLLVRCIRRCKDAEVNKDFKWIPMPTKLALALRYWAGGTALDYGDTPRHVSRSSFYRAVEQVRDVILSPLCLPDIEDREQWKDDEFLRRMSAGFEAARPLNPLAQHCVGCLDGLAVKIERPKNVSSERSYRNRKNFYSVNVQAICDAKRRFTHLSVITPGGTHDSMAFSLTDAYNYLCEGLPLPYFVACDEAYPSHGSLICPLPTLPNMYRFFVSNVRVTIGMYPQFI